MELVTGFPFESEKLCCWHSEVIACKGDDWDWETEENVDMDMAETAPGIG